MDDKGFDFLSKGFRSFLTTKRPRGVGGKPPARLWLLFFFGYAGQSRPDDGVGGTANSGTVTAHFSGTIASPSTVGEPSTILLPGVGTCWWRVPRQRRDEPFPAAEREQSAGRSLRFHRERFIESGDTTYQLFHQFCIAIGQLFWALSTRSAHPAMERTQMKAPILTALAFLALMSSEAGAVTCASGVYRAGCVGPNGAAAVRRPAVAVRPPGTVTCVNGVYRAGCVGPNGAAAVRKPY